MGSKVSSTWADRAVSEDLLGVGFRDQELGPHALRDGLGRWNRRSDAVRPEHDARGEQGVGRRGQARLDVADQGLAIHGGGHAPAPGNVREGGPIGVEDQEQRGGTGSALEHEALVLFGQRDGGGARDLWRPVLDQGVDVTTAQGPQPDRVAGRCRGEEAQLDGRAGRPRSVVGFVALEQEAPHRLVLGHPERAGPVEHGDGLSTLRPGADDRHRIDDREVGGEIQPLAAAEHDRQRPTYRDGLDACRGRDERVFRVPEPADHVAANRLGIAGSAAVEARAGPQVEDPLATVGRDRPGAVAITAHQGLEHERLVEEPAPVHEWGRQRLHLRTGTRPHDHTQARDRGAVPWSRGRCRARKSDRSEQDARSPTPRGSARIRGEAHGNHSRRNHSGVMRHTTPPEPPW